MRMRNIFLKALACAMIKRKVKHVKKYFKLARFFACVIEVYRLFKSINAVCTPVHAEIYKNDACWCYMCCKSLLLYGSKFLDWIPLTETQKTEFILQTHNKIRICWHFCPHYCSRVDIAELNITKTWLNGYASKMYMYLGKEFDEIFKEHGGLNSSMQDLVYKSKIPTKCNCFKFFLRLVVCHLIDHHIGNPYFYLEHPYFKKQLIRFYRIAQNIKVNIARDPRHRPEMCGDFYFYIFTKCRSFMHGVSHFPDKDCNKIIFYFFDHVGLIWSDCVEHCLIYYRDTANAGYKTSFDLMLHYSLPHHY